MPDAAPYALVVDDDIWMQRILSKTLENFGFRALTASNGFDGVALAIEHQPEVIFLDIIMPELSGHLTLKMLKRIASTKSIPVIMATAHSDTENLGMSVKSGANGFISKPFTRITILEKLRSIIGTERLNQLIEGSQKKGTTQGRLSPAAKDDDHGAGGIESVLDDEDTRRPVGPVSPQISPDLAARKYEQKSNSQQMAAIKELLLKKK